MTKLNLIYLILFIPVLSFSQDINRVEFDTFETIWKLGDNEPMSRIESGGCEMIFNESEGKYWFTIYSDELGEIYQGYEIIENTKDNTIVKTINLNNDLPDFFFVKDSIESKGKIELIKKNEITNSGEKLFFMFRYSIVSE